MVVARRAPDTLRVDPEFQALIPPLSPEEIAHLEENLVAEGCRDPLVLWDGILIDGHNRHAICTRRGIPFRTVAYAFKDRDAAKIWIIRNQFGRRNLSAYQRGVLALQLKGALATQARERQLATLRQGEQAPVVPNLGRRGRTDDALADVAGIAAETVRKIEHIEREAPPELKAQLARGDKSIHGAYAEIERAKKEAERQQARERNRRLVGATAHPAEHVAALGRDHFPTIVLDPPWCYGSEGDMDLLGRARPDYHTMPVAEIAALPVGDLAERDAHVYLWVTNHHLPQGFTLLDGWGFRYITCLTWCKDRFGMGSYYRGSTEHVLFGVRGSLPLLRRDVGTHFAAPRPGRHSAKPEGFYQLVQECSPGPWLEMFARGQRAGWATWGAEA